MYDARGDRLSDIQICNARVEDAGILAEAQRVIARTPGRLASTPGELTDESFRERIVRLGSSERGTFVVAKIDGGIVGHALLDPLKLAVTSHVVDLTIGFSHPVTYKLPAGVKAEVDKDGKLGLKSADRGLLGKVAADIRDFRPPEPYKGKGVRYSGETVRRKEGKKK